jgi:hypothetical protein
MEMLRPIMFCWYLIIPIAGEQYIPSAFSKSKELAVFLGSIPCLPYRLALVAHSGESSFQCNWQALIDQDFWEIGHALFSLN